MPLLANAVVSSTRAGGGILTNVPLRIYPARFESTPVGSLMDQAPSRFIADVGTNLQPADVLSGYNPLGITPPPTYIVRYVVQIDGLMPHLEGILLPVPNSVKLTQYQQIDQVGFMPDTCSILRDTPLSDGQGGSTSTYASVATSPCRLRPAGGGDQEIQVAAELAALTRWVLATPAGTDIRVRDRVQFGTTLFEVVAPISPETWEVERQVMLVEIRRQ